MFCAFSIRGMDTQGVVFMKGGVHEHISDLIEKYKTPIEVILVMIFTTMIVFLGKIPEEVRRLSDSFIGRASLLAFTLGVAYVFGWPLGILAALMSALLIGAGGIHETVVVTRNQEGFAPDMNVRIVPDKHKWHVEKVLNENPLMIEDSTVRTYAVQDYSERNGVSNGSVQSNSVSR